MNGLITGIQNTRKSLLIYGQAGSGKSSLGSEFPKPIFIGNEVPMHLDVAKFPNVKSTNEFFKRCQQLVNEKHDYQTLVVDSIDGLESMFNGEYFYPKNTTPERFENGFGRGNGVIRRHFYENFFMKLFGQLREKMTIVFITHEGCKLKMKGKKVEESAIAPNLSSKMYNLVCDIVDAIVYIKQNKHKNGIRRELVLTGDENVIAKNRWDIDYKLPYEKGKGAKVLMSAIKQYYKGVGNGTGSDEKVLSDGDIVSGDKTDEGREVLHKAGADGQVGPDVFPDDLADRHDA